jgi:hypothetical protein
MPNGFTREEKVLHLRQQRRAVETAPASREHEMLCTYAGFFYCYEASPPQGGLCAFVGANLFAADKALLITFFTRANGSF